MRWVGVDIGLSGGLALLDGQGRVLETMHMPTVPTGVGSKRQYDITSILALLTRWSLCDSAVTLAAEQQWGRPDITSRVAATLLGMGAGIIRTAAAARNMGYVTVAPSAWKRWAQIPAKSKKVASVARAMALCPGLLLGAKQDGEAEAVLIALYAAARGAAHPWPVVAR